MKVKSSLIVPILSASILGPTMGSAIAAHNTTTTQTSSLQKEDHHEWKIGEKQNNLKNIINQYASPQLKAKLNKDLATRKELIKQLRETPGFQQEKKQRQALYQAHKQEIDNIKQQVKDGKLTRQQAHEQLKAIFGETKNNGKEQRRAIFKELKAAIQKKDSAAINAALQKFDQHLENANQQLHQKINAYK